MTPLEIQIQTTADLQGLKLTEGALQRVKEATQQAASKGDAYVQAHSKVTDEMKQQAQAALKNIDATKKLANEADHLGRNVNSARTAFSGLKDVIGGALTGNILQVGQGFGKISSAATNASPAMQALFGQIARGAAAASVVAGPLLVLIAAFKLKASENEAAMKSMWDAAAKGADEYKQKSAEVKAAAEADLAAMIASVERLGQSYDDLVGRMDRAAARQKELNDANKDLELSAAKTPEQKAAIEAKYAAAGVGGDISQAGVRKKNAEETLVNANQEVRNAQASVRNAEQAFATNKTRANQDAVKAAKKNFDEVSARVSPVIRKAQSEIEDADQVIKIGGIREQTMRNTTASKTAGSLSELNSQKGDLRRTAEAAQARGDFAAQDAAVAELKRVTAAADKLAKAVISSGATTAASLNAASKEIEKNKKRTANTAQAGAGGG